MLEILYSLAEYLQDFEKINRIGLFGSLARGSNNPSDIDMAIFTDDNVAIELLRSTYEKQTTGHELRYEKWAVENELDISKHETHFLYICMAFLLMPEDRALETLRLFNWVRTETGEEISTIILSNHPSKQFIKIVSLMNDPTFLESIINDMKLYDISCQNFIKLPIYPPKTLELIHKIGFESLKEMMEKEENDAQRSQSHEGIN